MDVKTFSDYEQLSQAAADFVFNRVLENPRALLCLATGASPERTYQKTISRSQTAATQFSQIRVIKLDEWGGMPMTDPSSCEAYLQKQFTRPLAVSPERYCGFKSDAEDADSECVRVREWLSHNGPIDICILGLGRNGHLGLNEPGVSLVPFAHQATLTEATQHHSMLSGTSVRPRHGFTLGMAELLQSRHILLLVNGAYKRTQLQRLLRREISTDFPASLLWLHPQTTVFCDGEAAS